MHRSPLADRPQGHRPDQPGPTTTIDHSVRHRNGLPTNPTDCDRARLRSAIRLRAVATNAAVLTGSCANRGKRRWRARLAGLATAVPPLKTFEHQEPEDEGTDSTDHQPPRVNAAPPNVQGIDPHGHEQSPANIGQAQLATPSQSRSRPGGGPRPMPPRHGATVRPKANRNRQNASVTPRDGPDSSPGRTGRIGAPPTSVVATPVPPLADCTSTCSPTGVRIHSYADAGRCDPAETSSGAV